MSLPVKTGMPDNLVIADGYIIKFRAVDPTTGADVSGVNVSAAAIQASDTGAVAVTGPFQLVPGPGA